MHTETIREAELYEFVRGTEIWRYTPHEFDVRLDGQTYLSTPIARSRLALTTEAAKLALELTLPPDLEVVRAALHAPSGAGAMALTLRLAIQPVFYDNGVVTFGSWRLRGARWMGRVLGVQFVGNEARLHGESAFVSLKRIGLRRLYSRKCTHVLYSTACGAARLSAVAVIAYSSGRSVRFDGGVPAAVAGKLAGGWLELASGARHMISEHRSTATVVLLTPAALPVGETVTLVAGCDHTLATCQSRFNNLDNYGGFPGIPPRNPFTTSLF